MLILILKKAYLKKLKAYFYQYLYFYLFTYYNTDTNFMLQEIIWKKKHNCQKDFKKN